MDSSTSSSRPIQNGFRWPGPLYLIVSEGHPVSFHVPSGQYQLLLAFSDPQPAKNIQRTTGCNGGVVRLDDLPQFYAIARHGEVSDTVFAYDPDQGDDDETPTWPLADVLSACRVELARRAERN